MRESKLQMARMRISSVARLRAHYQGSIDQVTPRLRALYQGSINQATSRLRALYQGSINQVTLTRLSAGGLNFWTHTQHSK